VDDLDEYQCEETMPQKRKKKIKEKVEIQEKQGQTTIYFSKTFQLLLGGVNAGKTTIFLFAHISITP
jgi:hypothetical protein